jgi:excisionase family DNA binding protein
MPPTPTVTRSATVRRRASVPRNDRQLVFTSSQAAGYLGVSLATIRRWTDAGHVSCYRTPGGQRRFTRDQLDVFITSMHRDGGADRPPANGATDHAGQRGAQVA